MGYSSSAAEEVEEEAPARAMRVEWRDRMAVVGVRRAAVRRRAMLMLDVATIVAVRCRGR